jgi:hypothetical protein
LAYALLGLFGLGSVSFGKVFQEFLQSTSRNKGVYVKEKDRENVLSLINNGATKEYEMDDAGFLKESENQPQKEGSKTFTQMVDKLINADKKTVIGFDDKVLKVDENGKAYQEDVMGINIGTNGTDQVLVINPYFSSTIGEKETIGLLAHEMAHAIDGIEGTKTNDPFTNEKVALGSENNVREELGLDARELDTESVRGDGVYSNALIGQILIDKLSVYLSKFSIYFKPTWHFVQRLYQRGISFGRVAQIILYGQRYWDKVEKSTIYYYNRTYIAVKDGHLITAVSDAAVKTWRWIRY